MRKFLFYVFIVVVVSIYPLYYCVQTIGSFKGTNYKELIIKYSARYKVDPLLVSAVMKRESNLNPNAISNKGAIGLMQLMPHTAREIALDLNVKDYSDDMLKDPEKNVMFGTFYLKKLLQRYENNLFLALSSYNAGIGNVDVWRFINPKDIFELEHIPFKETKRHVRAIMFTYNVYKGVEKLKRIKPQQT